MSACKTEKLPLSTRPLSLSTCWLWPCYLFFSVHGCGKPFFLAWFSHSWYWNMTAVQLSAMTVGLSFQCWCDNPVKSSAACWPLLGKTRVCYGTCHNGTLQGACFSKFPSFCLLINTFLVTYLIQSIWTMPYRWDWHSVMSLCCWGVNKTSKKKLVDWEYIIHV